MCKAGALLTFELSPFDCVLVLGIIGSVIDLKFSKPKLNCTQENGTLSIMNYSSVITDRQIK
jgi:hypothetical protein